MWLNVCHHFELTGVSLIITHDEWRVWRFWQKPVHRWFAGGPKDSDATHRA